jgi:hypothetical protein
MGSRHSTAEETEAAYVAAMGAELGAIFYKLFCEIGTLRILWDQFVELFATKKERLSILNRSGGTFFSLVQQSFWQQTLLTLCRLTDRDRIGGRSNASICYLPGLVTDDRLKQELQPLIAHACESTKFARDWRNRRIAHTDLELLVGRSATELAAAGKDQVENAIIAIGAVLSRVQLHYQGSTLWVGSVPCLGGAEAVLHVLRDGIQAEDQRRERIRNRTYTREDVWAKPPL